jgi:hypothetical protein
METGTISGQPKSAQHDREPGVGLATRFFDYCRRRMDGPFVVHPNKVKAPISWARRRRAALAERQSTSYASTLARGRFSEMLLAAAPRIMFVSRPNKVLFTQETRR